MPNYDKLTREEMVKLCQALWLKNTDLERNIELYREQLKKNQQKMYGKFSEKSTQVVQDEIDLFDEADALAYEDEQEEAVNIVEHKRRKKKNIRWITCPAISKKNMWTMIWKIRIAQPAEVNCIGFA
ncbi:transposase domain-containing protein [[Clostridium] innocuum]|uniref:transposase domain-containing protein n=1 Tax=Clostridium innocuum TaxID=1522 RepID=UPI003A520C60